MRRLNQHWHGIPPAAPTGASRKTCEPNRQKPSESDKALHEQFVLYGQNAKEWLRKCVLLLPQIDRLRIWEKYGFLSIFEYAAKLAGMSRNKVKEGLRIMRKTENLPALRKVIEQKGIWAVKPVLKIATPENDKELAAQATNMNKKTLEVFVKELVRREDVRPEASPENPLFTMGDSDENTILGKSQAFSEVRQIILTGGNEPPKTSIWMDLDQGLAEQLMKLKAGCLWDNVIGELLIARDEMLEREKPEAVKTKSRPIPAKIERFVLKRSNGVCEFPGCMKKYAELHHADRFSLVWEHNPDRIFALCSEHHNLAHNGVIENESSDIKLWRVRQKPNIMDMKYVIDQAVIVHRKKGKKSGPPPPDLNGSPEWPT